MPPPIASGQVSEWAELVGLEFLIRASKRSPLHSDPAAPKLSSPRRRLLKYGTSESPGGGPSWLTFLGQIKDSVWSGDLFRCEAITLKSHGMLVVMDQGTRRLIGFGVQPEVVDGPALCHLSYTIIVGKEPRRPLNSDHGPFSTITAGKPICTFLK